MSPDDDIFKLTGNPDIQYVCSATARIQLAPELAARLNNKPLPSVVLARDGNEIGMAIIYTTEISSDRRLQVGVKYTHPLMKTMLTTLFRTDLKEEPKTPESNGSPGATDSQ